VILKYIDNLSFKIIKEVTKSAGFPDYFTNEYEKVDNFSIVYLLDY
jgi:hypothetical protein